LDEAVAHPFLKLHALLNDRGAAAAVQQGLLHAGEPAAQDTDDKVVFERGLRTRRGAAVELSEQADQPVGDRGQDLAVVPRLLLQRGHETHCPLSREPPW
jgi:hypothetical protein